MTIYTYVDYVDYLKDLIKSHPKNGRGLVAKIADQIQVNPTFVSQILGNYKDLNQEQAYLIAEFFGLTQKELEHFLLLVQFKKTGHFKLKKHLELKIAESKREGLKLKNSVQIKKQISEKDKTQFYSNWIYTAMQLYCSIGSGKSLDEISSYFEINRKKTISILQFLISINLLVEKNNIYSAGSNSTHLDSDSPHLSKHHTNWRIKALNKIEHITDTEMMFTAPLSISKNDLPKVREILSDSIKKISKLVNDSPSEELACLIIDYFKI